MKTTTTLTLTTTLILIILVCGCLHTTPDTKTGEPGEIGETKKITWYAAMLDGEWELYKPIVSEFTNRTGIAVEVELYGGKWDELSEKLKNEVESGKGTADVVTIDDFAVTKNREYVYDLTGDVEAWNEWDALYDAKKQSGVFDGRIYFIPWRADCLTMYVNIEKLKEHNLKPPETIDELIDTARVLHEKEGTGRVGLKAKKYEGLTCEIAVFINAYGGDYMTFNSESNVRAFESLRKLSNYLHPESKNYDEGSIPDAISGEDIYINFNWPYQLSVLEKNNMSEKIKAFPTPRGPVSRGTTTGGGFLAVSAASQNKAEAWEFIKFISSKRGQGMQLQTTGWLPVRDDAWDYLKEVEPAKYTNLMPYRETLRYGLTRPPVIEYPKLTELWQDAFREIVWENKTVNETLDKYQIIWESKRE